MHTRGATAQEFNAVCGGRNLSRSSRTPKGREANMFNRIHSFLTRDRDRARQRQRQEKQIEEFDLAPAKGLPYYLKFALFALFGYYNAKLFIVTVPGWEGYFT